MAYISYREQLLDPKWQKKRLQVLERDKFTCHSCLSTDNTLHVHHKMYKNGRMAWEYHIDDLVTLCHECHNIAELLNKQKIELIKNLEANDYVFDRSCPA